MFVRIVEEASLRDGSLDRTVSAMLRVPSLDREAEPHEIPLVIPLIYARRDRLLTAFTLDVPGASEAVLLPRSEALAYSQAALAAYARSLLGPFFERLPYPSPLFADLIRAITEVPARPFGPAWLQSRRILIALDRLTPLLLRGDSKGVAAFQELADMLKFFSANYILWASLRVRASIDYQLVKYSYQTNYAPRVSARASRVPGALRRFIPPSPNSIRVPVPLARHTESYHFQLVVPADQYVDQQLLDLLPDGQPISVLQDSPPHPQSLAPLIAAHGGEHAVSGPGSRAAHIYLSGAHLPMMRELLRRYPRVSATIRVRDIPPGTLGAAAWVLAAFIVVAASVSLNFGNLVQKADSPGDLVAIVVALPGLGAALARRSAGDAEFTRPTILTRLSLIYVGAASLVAAGNILLAASGGSNAATDLAGSAYVVPCLLPIACLLWIMAMLRILRMHRAYADARQKPSPAEARSKRLSGRAVRAVELIAAQSRADLEVVWTRETGAADTRPGSTTGTGRRPPSS